MGDSNAPLLINRQEGGPGPYSTHAMAIHEFPGTTKLRGLRS